MLNKALVDAVRFYFSRPNAEFGWDASYGADEFSSNPGQQGRCVYTGPNGEHCAVGCVIPPAFYTKKMEGKSASSAFEDSPGLAEFLLAFGGSDALNFLYECQGEHDSMAAKNAAGNIDHDCGGRIPQPADFAKKVVAIATNYVTNSS